jgi:hypothetical protein
MRCLSVRQPWAWLLINGYKDIENRTWKTRYRGPVLIHASSRPESYLDDIRADIRRRFRIRVPEELPTGGIVGQVTIKDCVTRSRSAWFEGPVGFVCTKARKLPFMKMNGKLGLYEVGPRVVRRLKVRRR